MDPLNLIVFVCNFVKPGAFLPEDVNRGLYVLFSGDLCFLNNLSSQAALTESRTKNKDLKMEITRDL